MQACARLCPTGLTEDRERPLTAEVARLQLPSQGLESGAFHVWGLYRFVSYGFTEIDGKTVTQPIWLTVKRSMRDDDDAKGAALRVSTRPAWSRQPVPVSPVPSQETYRRTGWVPKRWNWRRAGPGYATGWKRSFLSQSLGRRTPRFLR